MYEELIASIESHRKQAEALEAEIRNLPELEGIVNIHHAWDSCVIVAFPYDLNMFSRNRAKLEAAGWVCDNRLEIVPSCGEALPDFHKGGLTLAVHLNPGYSGSACKRSVIGYEKKPIYEVTCLEA